MAVPEPMLSCESVNSRARKPVTAAQRSLSFHSHKSQTLSTSFSCLQLNLGKTNYLNNIIALVMVIPREREPSNSARFDRFETSNYSNGLEKSFTEKKH